MLPVEHQWRDGNTIDGRDRTHVIARSRHAVGDHGSNAKYMLRARMKQDEVIEKPRWQGEIAATWAASASRNHQPAPQYSDWLNHA